MALTHICHEFRFFLDAHIKLRAIMQAGQQGSRRRCYDYGTWKFSKEKDKKIALVRAEQRVLPGPLTLPVSERKVTWLFENVQTLLSRHLNPQSYLLDSGKLK